MRVKSTLKNTFYSLASYGVTFIIGLITRRLFLDLLSVDFLGYDGLFSSIFGVLSLSDLGIGSVMLYYLYVSVAQRDNDETGKVLKLYQVSYFVIGSVILVLGIILSFFIPQFVKGNQYDWSFVRLIYFLQLAVAVSKYFFGYKRAYFQATQREFVCNKIDMGTNFATKVLKLGAIYFFQNYILYLSLEVANSIIGNLIIGHKLNKEQPGYRKIKISLSDFKARNWWKDVRDMMVTNVAGVVHGATDNMVISAFVGIRITGFVSNYNFITSNVNAVIDKIRSPISASIANFVHSEDKEQGYRLFMMFEQTAFFLASFVSISFLVLLQPFISLMFGAEYLMPFAYVIAVAADNYTRWASTFIAIYRGALGHFNMDRKYAIMAAISNIALSIGLLPLFNVTGVVIGTVISQLFFWAGRLKVIYSHYISRPMKEYIFMQLRRALLFFVEAGVCYGLSMLLPGGVIMKMVLCLIIPNGINLLVFHRTDEFRMILGYVKRIRATLKEKKEERK